MTFKNKLYIIACAIAAAIGLSSCEGIYDSRDNCVNGIRLRFLFDYHMEPGANAFAANVDCVTVYVFDQNGNYLTQYTETSSQLMEDNYRMVLPLTEGKYRLMIYGGVSCANPSFEISTPWSTSRSGADHDNIILSLRHENGVSKKKLHDIETRTGGLFYAFQYRNAEKDYETVASDNGTQRRKVWTSNSSTPSGTMEVTVGSDDYSTDYTDYEVNMMKDTNNIQVILQELSSNNPVDYNDYEYYIVYDNFVLDAKNRYISQNAGEHTSTYEPYAYDNVVMGTVDASGREGSLVDIDEAKPVQVACAEFSTSRLFVDHFESAKLIVKAKNNLNDDGTPKTIISLPLIKYLTATRGFGQGWIRSDQEYLDRQSNWTLYFFLQYDRWVSATIAVNDWVVRINDIVLGF